MLLLLLVVAVEDDDDGCLVDSLDVSSLSKYLCGKLLLRIVTTANIRHLNIHTSILRTNKAFNIQIEKYASDAVINTSTCNILTTTIKI